MRNQHGSIAVWLLSATGTWEAAQMSKRPPYVEVIVTALVMAFLTLVVIGGLDTGTQGFGQITMRSD
jgi:hypothetical protein